MAITDTTDTLATGVDIETDDVVETETETVSDELLVEEISIDGMCGVY